ncbi:hypothetical protein [Flavobacterium sp.]|uniref:hypothetical protein n=1 Tax=Flavobacterium sp. TaxID=239 RepID=UPI0025BD2CDB|nr:hypothetical protein [Flavobacterium sp.]
MKLFKTQIIFGISIIVLFLSNCDRKPNSEDRITITVNSIERETEKPRKNAFDTIELRIESFGFPKKEFPMIAQYITDSLGSVKIKIDRTEKYILILRAPYIYGGEDLIGEELKDGQTVTIDAIHLDKKK